MKILTIIASGRKGGTIERACDHYQQQMITEGDLIERINLFDHHIQSCIGCLRCCGTGECVLKDDFEDVFQKIKEADMIIIGTPIYCHDVPGILKVLMDRCCSHVVPFVDVDANAGLRDKIKFAKGYMKQFKENAPFKDKSFIIITACSTPGKNNKDMKKINHSLKVFVEEEMKGKVIKTIRITDTLFRFRKKSYEMI